MNYLDEIRSPILILSSVAMVNEFLTEGGLRILGTFFDEERDAESDYDKFLEI
jgi:hypothetical protein